MTAGGTKRAQSQRNDVGTAASAKVDEQFAASIGARAAKQSTVKQTATRRRVVRLTLAFIIFVGLIIAAFGTSFAYLTLNTGAQANPFTTPAVQIALIENDQVVTTPTLEASLGVDTKKVEIANAAGASDVVVRMTFSPQRVSADSTEERTFYEFFDNGTISAPVDNKIVMGNVTLHLAENWNDADNGWMFQDGFFYYNHVLEAGHKTPPLLTGVTTNLTDANVEVMVSAEGLQAYPDQAVAVWGVSIS